VTRIASYAARGGRICDRSFLAVSRLLPALRPITQSQGGRPDSDKGQGFTGETRSKLNLLLPNHRACAAPKRCPAARVRVSGRLTYFPVPGSAASPLARKLPPRTPRAPVRGAIYASFNLLPESRPGVSSRGPAAAVRSDTVDEINTLTRSGSSPRYQTHDVRRLRSVPATDPLHALVTVTDVRWNAEL
jgi:hypothetical protein